MKSPADDFMECVTGVHGDWWRTRADEFVEAMHEGHSPGGWGTWAWIRSNESEPPLLTLEDENGCRGYHNDCARLGQCQCDRLGRE